MGMGRDLHGKRAIVCGSTAGIGRATAVALAERGASVTLVARDEAKLRETRAALPQHDGASHDTVVADFTDHEQLRARIAEYLSEHGPAHILVNNTGGPAPGPIVDADVDAFLAAFRQHLACNHLLVQAVLPGMRQDGYGRIINVISTSVRQPIPGLGVSNTVRAAVAGWAKTLAREVGPDGITVNNVLPGFTKTERLRALVSSRATKRNVPEDTIVAEMQAVVPLRRFAAAEEVAAAVAFLASPDAAYITGVSLPVDGGRIDAL